VIPFLLGLKFKITALLPLALTLIALKTWKALTLGLLSVVLSAAMLIFKFTKPKVNCASHIKYILLCHS
jgi:VIT1/CCC1 family predicted Fe2+/Mn2+ transporter